MLLSNPSTRYSMVELVDFWTEKEKSKGYGWANITLLSKLFSGLLTLIYQFIRIGCPHIDAILAPHCYNFVIAFTALHVP